MSGRRDASLIEQGPIAVTPNDTLNFNCMFGGTAGSYGGTPANAIWVGTSGNVNVRLDNGKSDGANDIVMHSLIAGTWHNLGNITHIYATNTTAANIRAAVTARD